LIARIIIGEIKKKGKAKERPKDEQPTGTEKMERASPSRDGKTKDKRNHNPFQLARIYP
jgi:hypothetical protein